MVHDGEQIIRWSGEPYPMPPGMYRVAYTGDGPVVIVACGWCGCEGTLNHEIEPNGNIYPAVSCPRGCGWHVWATLEGWKERMVMA